MVALKVNLIQGTNNQLAEARLLDLTQSHVTDFQQFWQSSLRRFSQEDKYWDWVFKERAATNYGNYECYAVEGVIEAKLRSNSKFKMVSPDTAKRAA